MAYTRIVKKLIALWVLLFGIIGLLFYLAHQGLHVVPAPQIIGLPTATPPDISSTMGQFTIQIAKQKIKNGITEFAVKKGDEVVLHVTSDENEVLHLLGYEQRVNLQKNKEVVLSFIADKAGKYAFELQNHHLQLGILTINK